MWQPIKTAPKDNIGIMVWCRRWSLPSPKMPTVELEERMFTPAFWRGKEWVIESDGSGYLVEQKWAVTHWMPLPEPPK